MAGVSAGLAMLDAARAAVPPLQDVVGGHQIVVRAQIEHQLSTLVVDLVVNAFLRSRGMQLTTDSLMLEVVSQRMGNGLSVGISFLRVHNGHVGL